VAVSHGYTIEAKGTADLEAAGTKAAGTLDRHLGSRADPGCNSNTWLAAHAPVRRSGHRPNLPVVPVAAVILLTLTIEHRMFATLEERA